MLVGAYSTAQEVEIDTLIFKGIAIIPHEMQFGNETIEELSGIEYTGVGSRFIIIPQTKKKAYIFLGNIIITDAEIKVDFDSVIYLDHGSLYAESVRINPKDKQLYIAEERDKTSIIYKINPVLTLQSIFTSTKKQRHNRGYEGLCFSADGNIMYIGLERPKSGDITNIIAYNLTDKTEIVYDYPLDILPNDKEADNGITELLSLNDSTLLVIERAYLGSNENSVRIYKVRIPKEGNEIKKVKLLTDFSASPEIDNMEGVAFSASGKELIFVSDNNANSYQQTLFIVMSISPHYSP